MSDISPSALEFALAFEQWLQGHIAIGALRQPDSIDVYREMWGSFTTWCLGQCPAVTLDSLGMQDLQAFQAARFGKKSADQSLSPRHALRLTRLVDRVLRHYAAQAGAQHNTAALDWLAEHPTVRYANASSADPLPEFLSVFEAKKLITFLSKARPRHGLSSARRDTHAACTWQELRIRVALALQLGGGLTPADVLALKLASPVSQGGENRYRPWKISIPGHGDVSARETPIAPWAGELLQHWLQVLSELKIPGDVLLPSTRTGKPWSKKSHYAEAKRVFQDAGLVGQVGGTFKLRHTFALRQLHRGTEPEVVARWLGVEPEVMGRYRQVVSGPIDVV